MSTVHTIKLLPAPAGTCEQCAVAHEPEMPHNQQSLHWQYWFFFTNGRWPIWRDAMAHCSDQMKQAWRTELISRGVPEAEV